jgi:hypothetical protein
VLRHRGRAAEPGRDGSVESVTDGPGIVEAYYALLEAQGDPRPNGLIV